jgi:heat shock protein HtpX
MTGKFYNNFKTAMLLGLLTALIMWIGSLLGGQQGLVIAFFVAGITNFVALFFSDKIAIATMRGQEVGPGNELYDIVQQLVARANLPMPRVYVSPHPAPNAFATGRSPRSAAVCATAGLLEMLDRDEVAGVMAHELAHVKHRDTLIQTVAATIGGAISMLGYMFMFGGGGSRDGDGEGGHPLAALLVLLLGPLAAGLIQAAISRSREFNADTAGAEMLGNPMPLATALEKIHLQSRRIPLAVNPAFNNLFIIEPLNPMRTLANMFATHPPLEQRLQNLIGRETTGAFRYAA